MALIPTDFDRRFPGKPISVRELLATVQLTPGDSHQVESEDRSSRHIHRVVDSRL